MSALDLELVSHGDSAGGPIRHQVATRPWSRRGNPWRPPYILAAITGLYLVWSLLPVLIAVAFSFNGGKSRTVWQGFSLRWYTWDPTKSVLHDQSMWGALTHTLFLGVVTTAVTIPLGVMFALGLDRWRGRIPTAANLLMLLSFVIPEIVLGVGLLFMITELAVPFTVGSTAQVVGLVTFQLSYPVVIVRARLMTIGRQYEEAARDLGASPFGAMFRVLLPMLTPAIFASAVLVFADVIDDFVIVRYLSGSAGTATTSMRIYDAARATPTPALNALGSITLAISLLAVLVGWLGYRRFTKGSKDGGLSGFAAQL
jgi:spermidine/putrescine transport system permease protein